MSHQANIDNIKTAYDAFGELQDKVVFVGGASVSLYADHPVPEVRPTKDVDVVIEIVTYANYSKIDKQLQELGFKNDTTSNVICRYRVQDIIVDIMPTSGGILGFNNRWYVDGFINATNYVIDKNCTIKIFRAPYFLASKIEAFRERGGKDGRTSKDFEDIVYVLENREVIWEELRQTTDELREYLLSEIKTFLENPFFEDWVNAHTEWGSPPASYMIIEELREFVALK